MLESLQMPWYQGVGFALLLAIITYIGSGVYGLYSNYQKARVFGLPIVVSPVQPLNVFWALSSPLVTPFCQKYLPFGLDHYFNYVSIAWSYHDRYRSHEKYGDAFVVVNPKWIGIWVADASAIDEILSRRKDFTKPEVLYSSMEVFGPNVDTVEGATWQRHRKITAPPFNERNSGLVWKESLRQAGQMQDTWLVHKEKAVTTTCADTLTLALHVLTGAGFGQQCSFTSGSQVLPANHEMSYRDALCEVLQNVVFIIVFSRDVLNHSMMPKSLRRVGLAINEFESYMREMVAHERNLIDQRDSESGNLISSMIRSSDEGKAARESLSDDEIMGNLFIYNLAGHETTANTLAYAITLLSINPSLQDWLAEELSRVLGLTSAPGSWDYDTIFPQLTRTLAIMFETLRLYPPVVALSKINASNTTLPLTITSKQLQIPPGTFVFTNIMAAHTLPKYWGADTLTWNPKRWIQQSNPAPPSTTPKTTEPEKAETPPTVPKGAYKPWGEGPRVCPGKKFAQVEFVAVIAALFRDWSVSPLAKRGESEEMAHRRVFGVVEDSSVKITLQMLRPESVGLVWRRRRREGG